MPHNIIMYAMYDILRISIYLLKKYISIHHRTELSLLVLFPRMQIIEGYIGSGPQLKQ